MVAFTVRGDDFCIAVVFPLNGNHCLHAKHLKAKLFERTALSPSSGIRGPLDKSIPYHYGRAVAQAVSRWLPTAAARFRFWATCGIYGGQSGTGAGFHRILRFPLPIIPPVSLSS
jgi:hypothetical protein